MAGLQLIFSLCKLLKVLRSYFKSIDPPELMTKINRDKTVGLGGMIQLLKKDTKIIKIHIKKSDDLAMVWKRNLKGRQRPITNMIIGRVVPKDQVLTHKEGVFAEAIFT